MTHAFSCGDILLTSVNWTLIERLCELLQLISKLINYLITGKSNNGTFELLTFLDTNSILQYGNSFVGEGVITAVTV